MKDLAGRRKKMKQEVSVIRKGHARDPHGHGAVFCLYWETGESTHDKSAYVAIKMGSFHRVTRKVFRAPKDRKMRCSVKIYWSRNKGLLPSVPCLIHGQVA